MENQREKLFGATEPIGGRPLVGNDAPIAADGPAPNIRVEISVGQFLGVALLATFGPPNYRVFLLGFPRGARLPSLPSFFCFYRVWSGSRNGRCHLVSQWRPGGTELTGSESSSRESAVVPTCRTWMPSWWHPVGTESASSGQSPAGPQWLGDDWPPLVGTATVLDWQFD